MGKSAEYAIYAVMKFPTFAAALALIGSVACAETAAKPPISDDAIRQQINLAGQYSRFKRSSYRSCKFQWMRYISG
jgi:hypothetical protein